MVRKRTLGIGAAVAVVAAGAALTLTRSWQGSTEAVPEAAQVEVSGPYLDTPSPSGQAEESRLIYSTRTWKSYQGRTSGFAELFQLADGSRLLRLAGLSGLRLPKGANEGVWLSPQSFTSGDFHAGAVSLGVLREGQGGADYSIPDGMDLTQFASVVIADARMTPLSAAPMHP